MPSPTSPSYISSIRSPSPQNSTPPTSTSLSPAPSITPPPRPYTDPFDADSDDEALNATSPATNAPELVATEHSDFPLLRRTHLTTGYRAGLSAGKEDPEIAQRGFDAGYAIGATLGARVGWVLGALAALKGIATRGEDEAERAILDERIKEVEGKCSVERLAEIVEGVKGPQTVEEREGSGALQALGMREAERMLERWMEVVEGLCRDSGIEMKFPGMRGEAPETVR